MRVWVLALLLSGCFSPEPELNETAPSTPIPEATETSFALGRGNITCAPCAERVSQGGVLWEPMVTRHPDGRTAAFVGDGGGPMFYVKDGDWSMFKFPIGEEGAGAAQEWTSWGDPFIVPRGDGFLIAALGNTVVGQPSVASTLDRDVWTSTTEDFTAFTEPYVVEENEMQQRFIAGESPGAFHMPDREAIALDGNAAAITWVQLARDDATPASYHADLMLAESTDGGETWGEGSVWVANASPTGPYPFYLNGTLMAVYSSFVDHQLRLVNSSGSFELGPGSEAPDVAVDGGRVAIATASKGDALLYLFDGTWSGPIKLGTVDGEALRPAVTFAGGEVWIAYYDVGDDIAYRLVRWDDGVLQEVVVEGGMIGPFPGREGYGDYVFGLNGHANGASVTYVSRDDAGKWLHHSEYHFTADA